MRTRGVSIDDKFLFSKIKAFIISFLRAGKSLVAPQIFTVSPEFFCICRLATCITTKLGPIVCVSFRCGDSGCLSIPPSNDIIYLIFVKQTHAQHRRMRNMCDVRRITIDVDLCWLDNGSWQSLEPRAACRSISLAGRMQRVRRLCVQSDVQRYRLRDGTKWLMWLPLGIGASMQTHNILSMGKLLNGENGEFRSVSPHALDSCQSSVFEWSHFSPFTSSSSFGLPPFATPCDSFRIECGVAWQRTP